jgi:O-antigen/teichoic acid export membrane protein
LAGADYEHLSFAVMSVAYQVCLNGPALVLEWRLGTSRPETVGAFVAASTYLRAPSLLIGGISTHALVTLSRTWASPHRAVFNSHLSALFRRAAVISAPAIVVALGASPWVLPLYYGKPTNLPPVLLAALALSTMMAIAGAVGGAPLFAAELGAHAAAAWAAGAALTACFVVVAPGLGLWMSVGLVLGPFVAAIWIFALVSRLVGAGAISRTR